MTTPSELRHKFYVQLGSLFREQRTRQALSQEQIAESIGLSRQSVMTIESGKHAIDLHHALHIAMILGIGPQEIYEMFFMIYHEIPSL